MECFQVRYSSIYDSRVINYDRRAFIRLATGLDLCQSRQGYSVVYVQAKSKLDF